MSKEAKNRGAVKETLGCLATVVSNNIDLYVEDSNATVNLTLRKNSTTDAS